MKTETIQTISHMANKTTWAAAAGGFWGFITDNATLGLLGVLIALFGLIINWYYKRKADIRAEQESQLRIALLQEKIQTQTQGYLDT